MLLLSPGSGIFWLGDFMNVFIMRHNNFFKLRLATSGFIPKKKKKKKERRGRRRRRMGKKKEEEKEKKGKKIESFSHFVHRYSLSI